MSPRKILAIATANLRRTLRERSNVFFIFLFPMLLVFVLGAAFGGANTPRLGVVLPARAPLAAALAEALRSAGGVDVRMIGAEATLAGAVERGELDAGVLIPAGYDAGVTGPGGVTVRYIARPGQTGLQVAAIVRSVVQRESGRLRAAWFTAQERGEPFDRALHRVDAVASGLPQVTVAGRTVGSAGADVTGGRFDTSASTQLLLFLFVTALTGSTALVEARRRGMTARMLATPTSTASVLAGEALGGLVVSTVQGGFVMLCSGLLFGVHWGQPLAALALMLSFALVACGAGMLLGALARTPQVASAVGLLLGLGLAALGGTMMPLEFFSPAMRIVAHAITPHAWAVDAFTVLIRDRGGFAQILPQLAVLLATAATLHTLGAWRLRRTVVR